MKKLAAAMLFIALGSMSASAASYYVAPTGSDYNNGSSSAPFKTIQKAATVVTAGSTVYVLPGTYNITKTISTTRSGTASARIRFVSTKQWGAKIISKIGMPSTTWKNTGNYVDIMGFDITGDGNEGIDNWASNVRIIANHVHNYPYTFCKLSSPTGAGINSGHSYSAADNDVIGNVVHDIGYPNACNVGQGIYHANARGHIYNNVSYNNSAYGITLWHSATENTVSSNIIWGNGRGGIWIGASTSGVVNNYSTVSNNIVYNNKGYAIYEAGSTGPQNRYLNNLIYGTTYGVVVKGGGTQSGTLKVDPQFVSPTGSFLTGDYHLKSTSPAINRGTNAGAPTIDYTGGLRPFGTTWDIGIYEYGRTPETYPY